MSLNESTHTSVLWTTMKFLSLIVMIIMNVIIAKTFASEHGAAITSTASYQRFMIPSHKKELSVALHRYQLDHVAIRGTILLIHGSSFPSKLSFGFEMAGGSWVDYLTHQGYRVYMLDFLGYGDSDRYTSMKNSAINGVPLGQGKDVVHDIAGAVSFIKRREKIHTIDLLGHSWGSAVAALYAQFNPENIDNLVLYASIYPNKIGKKSKPVIVPAYKELSAKSRIDSLNKLAPKLPLLAPRVFETWGHQWLASDPLRNKNNVRFPAGPTLDVHALLRGESLFNAEKITANVLVIRGQYDKFPTNKQAYRLFNQLIQAKRKQFVTIGDGTHVIHLEKNRRQLYQQVMAFLTANQQDKHQRLY